MTCAGKLNFLILEASPRGSCDKSDSLKAFESVVGEDSVEAVVLSLFAQTVVLSMSIVLPHVLMMLIVEVAV